MFCLAPIFDFFRFDLEEGHFYLLTIPWSIGIGDAQQQSQLAVNLLVFGLIPIVSFLAIMFWLFYRYGRIYCGWLCPHFGVVELINSLMHRAIGKLSIWDKNRLPEHLVNGKSIQPKSSWWWLTVIIAICIAFIWTLVLMTYILNPREVYQHLWALSLSQNETLFLIISTIVLSADFFFARHLFCRFGCAVGMFQSLAWMSNRSALVVQYDLSKASQCKDCNNYCDHVCPMRLKPRSKKRHMFSCTQCTECLQACEAAQSGRTVLTWKKGNDNDSVSIPLIDRSSLLDDRLKSDSLKRDKR